MKFHISLPGGGRQAAERAEVLIGNQSKLMEFGLSERRPGRVTEL